MNKRFFFNLKIGKPKVKKKQRRNRSMKYEPFHFFSWISSHWLPFLLAGNCIRSNSSKINHLYFNKSSEFFPADFNMQAHNLYSMSFQYFRAYLIQCIICVSRAHICIYRCILLFTQYDFILIKCMMWHGMVHVFCTHTHGC